MSTEVVKWIWLGFAVLFFALATGHLNLSRKAIGHLQQKKGTIAGISGMSTGVGEFVADFNTFVDEFNAGNRRANLLAGCGYSLAALTALFSYFIV